MHNHAFLCGIPAALLALSGIAGQLRAAVVIGGPITNPANGHRYYLLSLDTWPASQVAALKLGGSLATINDDAEQAWVFETFSNFNGNVRNLWIGLTDQAVEGTFVWADGSKSTYRNWAVNAPSNVEVHDYVFMVHPANVQAGKWSNSDGAFTSWQEHPLCGVVEVPPLSVTIAPAVAIGWNAVQDKRYQVQWASEATGNTWLPFGTPIVGNGQANVAFDVVVANEKRFYRVVELP